MSINIDKLIPVTGSTVNSSFTGVTLAGTFLTNNTLIPFNTTQKVLQFTSADLVGAYFGLNSDEYTLAVRYFKSFDGSLNIPKFINFARNVASIISPYIRSGASTTTSLATIKAITSGAITFVFDGTNTALTGLNFSSITSLSQAAGIVQTALQSSIAGATVTWDSITSAFTVSNGSTTGTSTIAYCPASTLSTAMKLTQATGAVLSQGSPALSVTEVMTGILNITRDWLVFSTVFDATGTNPTYLPAMDYAAWADSQANKYVYLLWAQEANLKVIGNTSNIATVLDEADYPAVCRFFGTYQHVAFLAGIGASIDYTELNGTLDFASKSQTGLAVSCDSDNDYEALTEKSFNYYGNFAAKATEYRFIETGLVSGQYGFLDNIYNQGWLADALQNNIATLLQQSKRLPNNQRGYQILTQTLNSVMQQAVFNGVAESGNSFDAIQAAVLKQQAGYDITPQLTDKGYVIQVVPVTPEERAARIPPKVNIWYTNGGSINRLPINTIYVF